MNTAFGLDLAGYSKGKSGFVQADKKDYSSIEITIFQGHAFSEKHDTRTSLEHIAEREKELLISCCKKGRLLVDIPIDLQGLPYPNNARFIWELVKRPVDFAFDALPPLADRIGSPVARFLNLFSSIKDEFPLGKQIFESYPAGSLKLLNLPFKKYKNQQTTFKNGHWNIENGEKLAKIGFKRYRKFRSNLFTCWLCLAQVITRYKNEPKEDVARGGEMKKPRKVMELYVPHP